MMEQAILPGCLDVCCGGRMMWFDKHDPRAVFCDRRIEQHTLCDGRAFEVRPDTVVDFRHLPFAEASFALVLFDPPHLLRCGPKSWQGKKYGKLNRDTWREDLTAGWAECWRVLRPLGTLVFKWSETQIPVREVLACFPVRPLFGHTTTANLRTHWMCFLKGDTQ